MKLHTACLLALIILVLASPALGQMVTGPGEIDPENIDKLPFNRPLKEYVAAGAFLVAAMGLGFMPSKRTAG